MQLVAHPFYCTSTKNNARSTLKTQVLESCVQWPVQSLCTSAAGVNFLHKRGGFAKSWKFNAPAVENAPPRKPSTTDGKLTVLTEKSDSPHGIAMCFNVRARFCHKRLWNTMWTSSGQLPGAPRTPPGRASDASRTLLGRSPDTARTAPNRAVVFSNHVVFSNSV